MIIKEFECNRSNEGQQILIFKDENINVIARNQQRMKDDNKRYKITIELVTEEIQTETKDKIGES